METSPSPPTEEGGGRLNHVRLCSPMDCSPPGSSVCGILQAGILEWVAISYSRGSSQPRDQTPVSMSSALTGGFFTTIASWEPHLNNIFHLILQSTILIFTDEETSSKRINNLPKVKKKTCYQTSQSLLLTFYNS